jgi:hypothetical protein
MMNLNELMTNAATMKANTTADATVIATKVAAELKKFTDANANYDAMKNGIITANKAANKADPSVKLLTDADADAVMLSMGLSKTDITAKTAELTARITAEENQKTKDEFYKLLQETVALTAGLEAQAAPAAPAPESDLDKLIKLQVLQMTQQQNNNNLGDVLGALIGAGVASAIINDTATEAPTSYATAKPSRPTNREQYEAHKEVTRSNSAKRGQLYADMKAGRITLSQYMAGCASTWSDAAAEHADITSRRRG